MFRVCSACRWHSEYILKCFFFQNKDTQYFGNLIDRVLEISSIVFWSAIVVIYFFIKAERPSDIISLQNELLPHLNFPKLQKF